MIKNKNKKTNNNNKPKAEISDKMIVTKFSFEKTKSMLL